MDLRRLPLHQWPELARDEYEERSAIIAEGAGLTREAAEEMARDRVARRWEQMERERKQKGAG